MVLLFGSEIWLISSHIRNSLGVFHQQVIRRIMGWKKIQRADNICPHPPLEMEMLDAVLEEVDTYVTCHQNKGVQFIVTRPIMDLCLMVDWRPGVWVSHSGGNGGAWTWRGCGWW